MPNKSPGLSAADFLTDPAEEPLGSRLHTPGEQMSRVATVVPVQFAAPLLVERKAGSRNAIRSCQAPTINRRSGGADGSAASRSTAAAIRSTVAERSTSLTLRTDGPHRPRCCAIIALSPKIGV